jgi:hypothetical protein
MPTTPPTPSPRLLSLLGRAVTALVMVAAGLVVLG